MCPSTCGSSGPHHVLVNNTGGPPAGPLLDAGSEAFFDAIRKHIVCNQLLVRTLLPGMESEGYGRVVNIISTSVITPLRGLGVSNTTRGAVANWGRTLAAELGQLGITVNNVLPGYTDTERLRSLLTKWGLAQGMTFDEIAAKSKELVPLRRFADPAEVGAVVAFLGVPCCRVCDRREPAGGRWSDGDSVAMRAAACGGVHESEPRGASPRPHRSRVRWRQHGQVPSGLRCGIGYYNARGLRERGVRRLAPAALIDCRV